MRTRISLSSFIVALVATAACGDDELARTPTNAAPTAAPVATSAGPIATAPERVRYDGVPRADFNRFAIEEDLPFFWIADTNGNGVLDPSELAYVQYVPHAPGLPASAELEAAVEHASPLLDSLMYAPLAKRERAAHDSAVAVGTPRAGKLARELAQSRPTLLYTDLTKGDLSAWAPFVRVMLDTGAALDALYEKQIGVAGLESQILRTDTVSRAVFFRNHGPDCVAPETQGDTACTAMPDLPKTPRSTLYDPQMLASKTFCDELQKSKSPAPKDPFTVVRYDADKKTLTGIPYHVAYKTELEALAVSLEDAVKVIPDPHKEAALRDYLLAQAKAFRDGSWFAADEAWAKMNAQNSRWFVRAAPDETYGEPCNTKALFHLSFGLINQKSLFWQNKLDPRKTEMEGELAKLAGAPYKARSVTFKLPDFFDVSINAGDSRAPSGGTIGQSLPNFGPVANEGRGRTVAMTNLYLDPDGITSLHEAAASLLCASAMTEYTDAQDPQLMSTVLHEAAHNLGPAHQYKVNGKIDREAFGGPLASMLEELKAQTAALYFTDWLVQKGEVTPQAAQQAHVRDLIWAFGHMSRGMYEGNGQPKSYSQLAAIQVGALMKDHVLAWNADQTAGNGKDKGCFTIDMPKFAPAAKKLMTDVAGVKARGDRARGASWVTEFVDCKLAVSEHAKGHLPPMPVKPSTSCDVMATVAQRMLRQPKPSFLYGVKFPPTPH